jgi:hypothetical protein
MEQTDSWQKLSISFNDDLKKILHRQRIAAQFIALVGRYLIPEKPDKSNINMQYIPKKQIFLGSQLARGIFVGLQLHQLKLQILDENLSLLSEISLVGRSFETSFFELKTELQKLGVEVSQLKTKQPYQLDMDLLKDGFCSHAHLAEMVEESIRYRHNAEVVMKEFASTFSTVEPVRIWPHHFDTGTFATLAQNEKGEASKTIGLGWAIPDGMVEEPYFYLSFSSEKSNNLSDGLKELPNGKWMTPDWNGAVLPLSEILSQPTANEQYVGVKSFFENGIDQLLKRI